MSLPLTSSCSASASETVATIVPMWAMLRRSLSSLAAASLATALTRAAAAGGNRVPSNHTAACDAPPARNSSSRMMRADGMLNPIAALATVLARLIFARSRATSGISPAGTAAANSANRTASLGSLVGKRFLQHACISQPLLQSADLRQRARREDETQEAENETRASHVVPPLLMNRAGTEPVRF